MKLGFPKLGAALLTSSLIGFGVVSCDSSNETAPTNPEGEPGPGTGSGTGSTEGPRLLREGNLSGALNAFGASTTPADAFGRAIARLLLLVEHDGVDAILSNLNRPPLSASDVFGPDALIARYRELFRGSGTISAQGAIGRDLSFENHDAYWLGGFAAERADDGTYLSLEIPNNAAIDGRYSVDCSSSSSPFPRGLHIYLDFDDPDVSCRKFNYSPRNDPGCKDSFRIEEQFSEGPDNEATYTLADVPLNCECFDEDECDPGDLGVTRLSGSLTMKVDPRLNAEGLPALLDLENEDQYRTLIDEATPGFTFGDAAQLLKPVATELERVADDLSLASQGSGPFVIPGELFAARDVSVSAADARVAAGVARGGAAAILLATSHDFNLEVRALCSPNTCVDEAEVVPLINAAVGGLRSDHEFSRAGQLLEAGLRDLLAGVEAGSTTGLIAGNGETAVGLDVWRDEINNAIRAFSERIVLDWVNPPIEADLGRFFSMPFDAASVSIDPLVYEDGDLEPVEAFFTTLVQGSADIDFDARVESERDRQMTDVLEQVFEVFARANYFPRL